MGLSEPNYLGFLSQTNPTVGFTCQRLIKRTLIICMRDVFIFIFILSEKKKQKQRRCLFEKKEKNSKLGK